MRRALLLTLALGGGALASMPGINHGGHSMPAPISMQAMSAQMLAELRPLRGRAFDVRFAQWMMDHHQMAVDMARGELRLGQNAQVKAAARRMIAVQEKEITLMGTWVKAWTGKAYRPKTMPLSVPSGNADRWFLTEMIPHHRGAIQMARLVMPSTHNAELRKLATVIIRDQTDEIAEYSALLKMIK